MYSGSDGKGKGKDPKSMGVIHDTKEQFDREIGERETKEMNARLFLVGTLSLEYKPLGLRGKTAKEVWDDLKNKFEDKGPAPMMQEFSRLLSFKKKENEKIGDMIVRFETSVRKVQGYGEAISDTLTLGAAPSQRPPPKIQHNGSTNKGTTTNRPRLHNNENPHCSRGTRTTTHKRKKK